MKNLIFFLFIVAINLLWINSIIAISADIGTNMDTVILASSDDPYYSLAEEISATERIPVYQSFEDAAGVKPVYLLWVIAPEKLSEKVLMSFSQELNHLHTSISVGIISGKTLTDAAGLWKGSFQIPGGNFTIINGTKGSNGNKIKPEIITGSDTQIKKIELTKHNLVDVLQSTKVIQISLEGAAGLWFDKHLGITVKSTDIPKLNSSVIQCYGCSTFRPWKKDSIALECISKGALAYCGFIYPSVAGTRFGDYTDITMLHTWEKFPLGHLVQLQNHAAIQSYAKGTHYFMFGDPRIYCDSEIPYETISDKINEGTRIIKLSGVKSGLIPIYIKDGADYDYIDISGLTSSALDSTYFNSRLQMIDINNDKYIIIDNKKDMVTIEMKKEKSFFRTILANTVSFLDLTITKNQDSILPMVLAVPVLILLATGLLRKRYSRRRLTAALIFGAAAASIALLYVLIRKDNLIVSNIPVSINWFYICSIFIFTGYGELKYSKAKKPAGKIIAVLVANFNALFTFIVFAGVILINMAVAGEITGIDKPGYPWVFAFKELTAGSVFIFAAYYLFNKLLLFPGKQNKHQGGMDFETGK